SAIRSRVARESCAVAGIPTRSKAYKRSSRPITKTDGDCICCPITSGKASPIHSRPGALESLWKGRIRTTLLLDRSESGEAFAAPGDCCANPAKEAKPARNIVRTAEMQNRIKVPEL